MKVPTTVTSRRFILLGLSLPLAALGASVLADMPAATTVTTAFAAVLAGLVYGRRSVLPSVQAAADKALPIQQTTPWIPVYVLIGMFLLPRLLPAAGR